MNHKNRIDEASDFMDEVIELAVRLDMEREDVVPIITDEEFDRLNIPPVPDDMFERIMETLHKEETPRKTKRFDWKKITPVAVILAITFSALTVKGFPKYIYEISSQMIHNGINLFVGKEVQTIDIEAEEAFKAVESEIGYQILKPRYIPKGTKYQGIDIYENNGIRFSYVNENNGSVINFTQKAISDGDINGSMTDTKGIVLLKKNINGHEVTIIKIERDEMKTIWLSGFWKDNNMLYEINTNLTEKEMVKFIEQLQK